MTLDEIEDRAAVVQLSVMGITDQDMPEGAQTLVLLGPKEPEFWPVFEKSSEYLDGLPDPLDRWSTRVVGQLAHDMQADAFFPFGGPPYQPFLKWAQNSGRSHVSPVGLLVHDTAGMMVSFRGALGFPFRIESPPTVPSPCASCAEQPCLTACPVDAFASGTYDVAACKEDLDRDGNDCMDRGCAVRRACPVSQRYARVETQSAFHMRAFR